MEQFSILQSGQLQKSTTFIFNTVFLNARTLTARFNYAWLHIRLLSTCVHSSKQKLYIIFKNAILSVVCFRDTKFRSGAYKAINQGFIDCNRTIDDDSSHTLSFTTQKISTMCF